MIRTEDGRYWLSTRDEGGRERTSYLGKIGDPAVVEAWCASKGIEYRQMVRSSATPARTRRPASSGRNLCTSLA